MRVFVLICILLAMPGAMAGACRELFGAVQTMNGLAPARALEELIAETGVPAEILRQNSARLMSAHELLRGLRAEAPGYLLGVDRWNGATELFASTARLKCWGDAYHELRIFPRAMNHTRAFLEAATKTGKQIVFLVPPRVLEEKSITRDELMWFLENPARMKNVTFVFGAYELFTPALLERHNRNRAGIFELLEGRPDAAVR